LIPAYGSAGVPYYSMVLTMCTLSQADNVTAHRLTASNSSKLAAGNNQIAIMLDTLKA